MHHSHTAHHRSGRPSMAHRKNLGFSPPFVWTATAADINLQRLLYAFDSSPIITAERVWSYRHCLTISFFSFSNSLRIALVHNRLQGLFVCPDHKWRVQILLDFYSKRALRLHTSHRQASEIWLLIRCDLNSGFEWAAHSLAEANIEWGVK